MALDPDNYPTEFAQDFGEAVDALSKNMLRLTYMGAKRLPVLNDVLASLRNQRHAQHRLSSGRKWRLSGWGWYVQLLEWIEEDGRYEVIQDGQATRIGPITFQSVAKAAAGL